MAHICDTEEGLQGLPTRAATDHRKLAKCHSFHNLLDSGQPLPPTAQVSYLEMLRHMTHTADEVFVKSQGFYYTKSPAEGIEALDGGLLPGSLYIAVGVAQGPGQVRGWKPQVDIPPGKNPNSETLKSQVGCSEGGHLHAWDANGSSTLWVARGGTWRLLWVVEGSGLSYKDPLCTAEEESWAGPYLRTPKAARGLQEEPTLLGTIGEAMVSAFAERYAGVAGQALTATGRDQIVAGAVTNALDLEPEVC